VSHSGFTWVEELIRLQNEKIDETHREFVRLVNNCTSSSKKDFPSQSNILFKHTQKHVASEEIIMKILGDAFIAEHTVEHARVLD
jgi:hemerythrin